MSKFEFGDIIRGAVIALGNDELNEVPFPEEELGHLNLL